MVQGVHLSVVLCIACVIVLCGASTSEAQSASCLLLPLQSAYTGNFTLTMKGEVLTVEGTISGLEPNTEHGLHIHEFGLVVPGSDGSALGGHYNPTGVDHGCPPKSHHAGDFGNIVANAAGAVSFKMSTKEVSLTGDHPVLGRSIVVHAGKDDCVTNPSGNSGARGAACSIVLSTV